MSPEIQKIIDAILELDERRREEFREAYIERFCMHCGREQPTDPRALRCQCWNDE